MKLTADSIQNLCACARQALVNLRPAELSLLAVAFQQADEDMAEMRKPAMGPIAAPSPTGEAAPMAP